MWVHSRGFMLLVSSGVASILLLVGLVGSGQATFPGADGKIVFQDPRGGALFTIDPDGGNESRIPRTGPHNGFNTDPSLSSGGARIVFSHTRFNPPPRSSIVVMHLDGSNRDIVIRRHGVHLFDPSFSPSGGRIVFELNRAIFAVRTSGRHIRELADTRGFDLNPSFSPNGKLIVSGAGHRIMVMRSDGTHQHLVARGPNYGEPSFAPGGKRILFTGGASSSETLLTNVLEMNVDGTGRHHVTTDASDAGHVYRWAHFSPEGTRIVFVSENASPECTDCDTLEVMNADGGNQHPLTNTAAILPDWGPAAASSP
jgi:Tol biopolymer transport system component